MGIQRTPGEQLRFLTGRAAEVMAERIANEVPPKGSFQTLSVSFIMPGTRYRCALIIEHSCTGTIAHRRLQAGVLPDGTDRLRTAYLLRETNENIIRYLKQEGTVDELIGHFRMQADQFEEES